jgi:ATP-dependent exoDNAse (exonuclease V) alpha subunit
MAIFKLQIESIQRTPERSAPGAAAYRAGEKIRDERTGKLHNHSRRTDVTHKEIMLPAHLSGADMSWAKDRASLWNAAEYAEARRNARVAREVLVSLPAELSTGSRLSAARTFSQEIADHYGVAVDLAVHDPRPSGDPRNFHAHLLLTTREVTADGLGAKTGLDLDTRQRVKLGLPNESQEFTAVRARWATILNEALREANLDVRVDHRSLAAQGIDREPTPHIPFAAFKLEKAGKHSDLAEEIRARYKERQAAREAREPEHTPTKTSGSETPSQPPPTPPPAPKSLADIRREARENWLRMRTGSTADPKPADAPKKSRGSDDDHQP